ncbi:MAG: hypothetical protein FJ320_08650 [SAR202 cluster bacterium]|nr:hypothetical protein [SAR202 cluster bacterium]
MAQPSLGTVGYLVIDLTAGEPVVVGVDKQILPSYEEARAEAQRIFGNFEGTSRYFIAELIVEPEHEYTIA